MNQVISPHLDIRVTDYHEMVMRADLRKGKWKKINAGELVKRQSNWIIPVSAIENVHPCRLNDSEIGFIGWYLTDGCLDGARVRISQSKNSPQWHHEHIVSCLNGCGFRYSRRERTRTSPFNGESITEIVYGVSSGRKSTGGWDRLTQWLDKSFPIHVFEQLDRRQFGVLLYAMNLGDGLKHTTYNQKTISLAVANEGTAGRIQSLAIRRGYRCNVARHDYRNGSIMYVLHIRDSQMATVGAGAFCESHIGIGELVWCVQTETGTIVTRRHGKVCIMGNCWWRHGSLNSDREWNLSYDDRIVAGMREKQIRDRSEPEPITCPKCHAIRMGGPKCHGCGYEHKSKSRYVMQANGTLREAKGDIYKQRRMLSPSQRIEQEWVSRVRAIQKSKKPAVQQMTFAQLDVSFARDHNWQYAPRGLPMMPKEDADWFRPVKDFKEAQ